MQLIAYAGHGNYDIEPGNMHIAGALPAACQMLPKHSHKDQVCDHKQLGSKIFTHHVRYSMGTLKSGPTKPCFFRLEITCGCNDAAAFPALQSLSVVLVCPCSQHATHG